MTITSSVWTEEIIEVAGTRLQIVNGRQRRPAAHPSRRGGALRRSALARSPRRKQHIAHSLTSGLRRFPKNGLGNEHARPRRLVSARARRVGLAGCRCHRLLAWRLARRGDGDDVPAAVQQDDSCRRGRRQAQRWRDFRHLPRNRRRVSRRRLLGQCLRTPEFATVRPPEPSPEQMEAWLVAREEACRLSWKPYMHYPALPQLLGRVQDLPTLLVWGAQDFMVPVSAGEIYNQSIKGSRLEIIDDCGHRPEIEKTDEFLALVQDFFAGD